MERRILLEKHLLAGHLAMLTSSGLLKMRPALGANDKIVLAIIGEWQ